jgi:hypothetical protein
MKEKLDYDRKIDEGQGLGAGLCRLWNVIWLHICVKLFEILQEGMGL